jgi:hypothetical protein
MIMGLAALVLVAEEWLQCWLTDHRLIYKTGLISRHTAEMNMSLISRTVNDCLVIVQFISASRAKDWKCWTIRNTITAK